MSQDKPAQRTAHLLACSYWSAGPPETCTHCQFIEDSESALGSDQTTKFIPVGLPLVVGVGRDSGVECAVIVYCQRRPTDDELRAIHEAAAGVTRA